MTPRALTALTLALSLSVGGLTGCTSHSSGPQVPGQAALVPARSPLAYGSELVERAVEAAHASGKVRLMLESDPEASALTRDLGKSQVPPYPGSFVAIPAPGETVVVGRDAAGALYGALEIAERLERDGEKTLPLQHPITGMPAVQIRGANLFLVLPTKTEKKWWFYDLDFWTEYLDLLARSRINFLDIHGMYNLENTQCPNALLYFSTSPSHPEIGAPAEQREANVKMLALVVAMAKERGIEVGMMSYRSDTTLTGDKDKHPVEGQALEEYTREAVKALVERVPGLARLGFRIGESHHPASWYAGTLAAGLDATSARTGLSTRTWMTKKDEIMSLVQSTKRDTLVEAKYNGEQMGPPYLIAGGLLTHPESWFSSYSYQDYLDEPAPYTFLFHIWGGGTNRVFRFANHDHIRRVVESTHHGSARGFTIMPTHAFYPQEDFWHASESDRYSPWAFRRDELEYLMFGRLAYDRTLSPAPFRAVLAKRTGTDGLWDALQAGSLIPTWIATANACGPDQRQTAPELEWMGPVGFWASKSDVKGVKQFCHTNYHGPIDQFAIASPHELAEDMAAGRGTSRMGPVEMARTIESWAKIAGSAANVAIDTSNAEARDVVREAIALSHLGYYFAHKMRAAGALAIFARTGARDYLDEARERTKKADGEWKELVRATGYIQPFEEKMRMGERLGFLPNYHWSMQSLDEDLASIDAIDKGTHLDAATARSYKLPPAKAFLEGSKGPGPGLTSLYGRLEAPGRFKVEIKLAAPPPAGTTVRLLYKSFSGLEDWQSAEAKGSGTTYEATVSVKGPQALFAAEVAGGLGTGWRYPDAIKQTPYVVLATN